MIQRIEEISMNAWPTLQTIHYDGWIIRLAEGVTKRSNSINLLYESKLEINSKIDFCEKLYSSRNIPVCFKLTKIAQPKDIEKILNSRGYEHDLNLSVQLMNINNLIPDFNKKANISEMTDDRWLDSYLKMNQMDLSTRSEYKKILDQIILPKSLLTVKSNGLVIGCGLGVVEDTYLGLYDIVIDKKYRNQGFGKMIIDNLLKWGSSKGAEIAYLQVLTDNAPAIRMYEKLGFKEVYKYWYRIKK
jgi:ribosomal protein S18 acetylase RimI-like enzyme